MHELNAHLIADARLQDTTRPLEVIVVVAVERLGVGVHRLANQISK